MWGCIARGLLPYHGMRAAFGFFGRAGDSVVPYVSVCLGYVDVVFGRGGGLVCLFFMWLVLVLVAAVVSSVSFGWCWFWSSQWFRWFLFFRLCRRPFRWFRLFLFVSVGVGLSVGFLGAGKARRRKELRRKKWRLGKAGALFISTHQEES